MNFQDVIDRVSQAFEREPRLIRLPSEGKVVLVGDTHGDLDASERVVRQYLKPSYRIVFLGDYVDRGDESEENITFLLRMKQEHPEQLFLLAGNHEGYMVKELHPANFWESIPFKQREQYGRLFSKLPLCATSANGLIALHGALPELNSIEEVNQIHWGDSNWDRIVWGDFIEANVEIGGDLWGRPQFGRAYFERLMERYQKKILVRSHQPHASSLMFGKRCITIFTSHAYPTLRTIVIADLEKEIRDARDVMMERI